MGIKWLSNRTRCLRQFCVCCSCWNGKYIVNPEMIRCKRCCCVRRRLLLAMLWINAGISLCLLVQLFVAVKTSGENEEIQESRETNEEMYHPHQENHQPSSHIIINEVPVHETVRGHSRDVVLPQIPYSPPFHQPFNHKLSDTNFKPMISSHEEEEYARGGISAQDPFNHRFPGFPAIANNELWPLPQPELPKITRLEVKCERDLMKVAIEFDRPFHGLIFSKGHYTYGSCIHVPAGLGKQAVYFDILMNTCGTNGDTESLYGYRNQDKGGSFFENTIIIQFDPQVQEVWDLARKLRCTWHDYYERLVAFRPFPVDTLEVLRAEFAGDDVGCWMQIQSGKGPWANEVSGIVKIGQTMTLVLAVKDAEDNFDMLVRNCIAHDGKKNPIELVDGNGCISRPKLLSRFTKVKNFGTSASVLSFAHFQAFKFPDSMEVHFQCTIQICRHRCPDQCTVSFDSHQSAYHSYKPNNIRRSRSVNDTYRRSRSKIADGDDKEVAEVGLNRIIRVVSDGDLSFSLPKDNDVVPSSVSPKSDDVCMPRPKFTVTIVGLFLLVIISGTTSAVLCLCRRKITADILAAFNNLLRRKRCDSQ